MSTSTDSQKKHSWSFGFKNPKKNIKQAASSITQPATLPKQFFVQLIKLEADFHNKVYTLETLEQLTQYYAKAVEHYDNLKDEISSYFILKIQDILATRKSLTMLSEHRQKMEEAENKSVHHTPTKELQSKEAEIGGENQKTSFDEDNIVEENSEEEDDFEIDHLEHKRKAAKRNRANRASITQIRNEKQRFVHFFYKMENEKVNEKQNMNNVLNEYESSRVKNDSCINNNLEKQKERLRNRLEQRRIESFQSQTVSVASYRNPLNLSNIEVKRTNNDPTLDLVLKELDEGDEVEFGRSISGSEPNTGDISPRGFGIPEEDESNSLDVEFGKLETKKALISRNVNLTENHDNLWHKNPSSEIKQNKLDRQNKNDVENDDLNQEVDGTVPSGH